MLEADIRVDVGALSVAVALEVGRGEVVAVLGPNGAGKTTVVSCLAGLRPIDDGVVRIDDVVVDQPADGVFVPAERRHLGVVFQESRLFPHLDVRDNVAFGVRAHGHTKAEARVLADRWLDTLGVADIAATAATQLSGGEAQRVALARALATEPSVLLLDEPLSSLDGAARLEIRRDIRRHLDAFNGATVLVTHDPLDAIALADRVVIVEKGRITQEGTIAEVTRRPRSRYVADLVGANLFRGQADGLRVDLVDGAGTVVIADAAAGAVFVLIRPHSVTLSVDEPEGSARNRWQGPIEGFDLLGDRVRVHVGGALDLVAEVTHAAVDDMRLREGSLVWASVKATEVSVYAD